MIICLRYSELQPRRSKVFVHLHHGVKQEIVIKAAILENDIGVIDIGIGHIGILSKDRLMDMFRAKWEEEKIDANPSDDLGVSKNLKDYSFFPCLYWLWLLFWHERKWKEVILCNMVSVTRCDANIPETQCPEKYVQMTLESFISLQFIFMLKGALVTRLTMHEWLC